MWKAVGGRAMACGMMAGCWSRSGRRDEEAGLGEWLGVRLRP